jgi:hypothetical protein
MTTLDQRYEAIGLVLSTMPVAKADAPAELDSRGNFRGHTRARIGVNKRHVLLGMCLAAETKARRWAERSELLVVRITRIAPRQLDDDNAESACKSLRDGFAKAVRINDRDPRVRYVVDQVTRSGPPSVSVQLFTKGKR